jgi:hypothetical protein
VQLGLGVLELGDSLEGVNLDGQPHGGVDFYGDFVLWIDAEVAAGQFWLILSIQGRNPSLLIRR